MRKIERVALIGLGAIGSAYAQRLAKAEGVHFTVIAGGARKARLMEEGVMINGEHCFFSVTDQGTPVDLVIFCTKYHQLGQAIEDVKSFVGPDTLLLSLLNGISSDERIGEVYGMKNILFGKCVGIDAVREEAGVRFSSVGCIQFGRLENDPIEPEVRAVAELFDAAGIPYDIPADMRRAIWWKFMVNVGVNQVSAVLGAPYGVFMDVPEAHALMRSTMEEVIALSQAAGVNLVPADMDALDAVLFKLARNGKTSMLQDMEAGRKTEVELFSGAVIELGKKFGVPTPVNEMLYKMIVAKEKAAQLDI
ncbi:MAG: ketopantoate reductase family protein [Bacillota bacterium]